jgi:hypothetical protein
VGKKHKVTKRQPRGTTWRDVLQVLLEYKVDPSLLSGICVNIGDKYIDLSAGPACFLNYHLS